jgi:hypothetical protein
LFKKKPPLTGAPASPRQKTYSAQSGYVYQYFYKGYRPVSYEGKPATEFVFDVSADRKTSAPLSVYVPQGAVRSWEENHGRTLNATEVYAAAKMALFQAFDERPNPGLMKQAIVVRAADAEGFLATLGID